MLLLCLLWLFQVVFLDSFYRSIKKSTIERTANQVASHYKEQGSLISLQSWAYENEFHIRVVTNQGILISESVGVPSVWIQTIIGSQYQRIYEAASNNDGYIYLKIDNGDMHQSNEYITYVKIVDSSTMVVIQALVAPVNATVSTLKFQLWIITGILGIVALLLSWILSRRLSKPIVTLNEEARVLGISNKQNPFDAAGYLEVNELSKALNSAHQSLSQLDKLRRELLANVSHDLKTPLTMIHGYGELMRDVPHENTPENAQIIVEEALHLTRLVDDLLDLSKLQEGIESVELKPIKVVEIIDKVLSRYVSLGQGIHDQLYLEIDSEVWVECDAVKIHQVMYNLINNAFKHGGEGVIVTIRTHELKDTVRIEVEDTGPGLSEDVVDSIWDRYVKSNTDHTREQVGTGLGLAIVKHVLQLHNVPFGVESKLGEGTVFWFEMRKYIKDGQE